MIKSQNSLFYVRRNKLEACPTFHKIKCASVYTAAHEDLWNKEKGFETPFFGKEFPAMR
jgi:hypothetical protein